MQASRILVASGRTYVRRCVAHVLAMEGFEVLQAPLEGALEAAPAARPHLIVLDAAQNLSAAYALCARAKRDPDLQGVPVLIIPPGSEDVWHDLARAAGAEGSLALVGDAAEIVSCVSHVLAGLPPTGTKVRVQADTGGDALQCRIARSLAGGELRLVPLDPCKSPFGLANGSRLQLADGSTTWRAVVRSDGVRGLDVKVARPA